MENQEHKFPTEILELPSQGLLYPEGNPLSSGKIEMRYMTAQHEDILTNTNYIEKKIVFDKLFQSLIVSKINYDDLLLGDKDAIMIASRILGYGKDYTFDYFDSSLGRVITKTVDLSQVRAKPFDTSKISPNKNEFSFKLPLSGIIVTYKALTVKDEKLISAEIEGLKKIDPNLSTEVTTRLKHIITSVDGNRDTKYIRDFIDNYLRAQDAQALRKNIKETIPGIDLTFYPEGAEEGISIPVTAEFFWPKP